jgi:hypothetical protein
MDGLAVNGEERIECKGRPRIMCKKRQKINTGEYDLPIPDDSPPASEPFPWNHEDRRKAGVFLAWYCGRPILAAQRSTQPVLHDELQSINLVAGDELISTRVCVR